ncbi:hypothetical protein [Lentzea flaviverrucosa]|uniref:Lipoprotein n=1 Tax=Lentzea flaviverrucosa TaxID=200379 RepID=A0A1H9XX58_9PSEU|nr:hypothetical protein [Lentzea flaviverrucosa]RDI17411.1 hypothetical protein DFR72_12142 [Lentzea flaviverrucosa]SES50721.1 hypothetical protein SAMN05216195_121146 [Lentzea flaviverrucosa]
MRNAVAAVALAVVLAGCSSGTQSSAPGSGSSGATPTGTTAPGSSGTPGSSGANPSAPVQPPVSISEEKPVIPPDVTPVAKDKVDTTSLSDTYRDEAYVFGDGRDVEVFGVGGGCKEARAEITGQSADVVQITLVTITKQPAGTICSQEIRQVPLTVRLDAPLGNRRLVLEAREETG